jgi:cysteine-rich repeat protein
VLRSSNDADEVRVRVVDVDDVPHALGKIVKMFTVPSRRYSWSTAELWWIRARPGGRKIDRQGHARDPGSVVPWTCCACAALVASILACSDSKGGDASGTDGDTHASTTAMSGETAAETGSGPGPPTTSSPTTSSPPDGTTDDPGTTNTSLPGPLCGNGVVDDGEPCDDGNDDDDDGCDGACRATGVAIWTVTSAPSSTILGVGLDAAGNIYLAGYAENVDSDDAIVRKLAPDGSELLALTYDDPDQDQDYAYAIAVDPDGSFYVAGQEGSFELVGQAFVRKYDPGGQALWAYLQPSSEPVDGRARTTGLAVDGDTIAAVVIDEFVVDMIDVHVLALDGAGQKLWSDVTVDGLYNFGVALAPGGDIVAGGGLRNGGDDIDAVAIRYSPDGQEQWRRRYLDQADESGDAHGLAIHTDGDIVLVGERFHGRTGYDIWLARLDPQGQLVWSEIYERDEGFLFDTGYAVAWLGDDIYVGGKIAVEGEYDNRWVGRFSGVGAPVWTSSADSGMHNGAVYGIAANDAMVVAAGYEDVEVSVATQWIRAYQP